LPTLFHKPLCGEKIWGQLCTLAVLEECSSVYVITLATPAVYRMRCPLYRADFIVRAWVYDSWKFCFTLLWSCSAVGRCSA